MNGESFERRAKTVMEFWPLILMIGAFVTGYLNLRATVEAMKSDFESQKARRDAMVSDLWAKHGEDHDRIVGLEHEVAWLKKLIRRE